MIVYRLLCAKGHTFDEWFASSADYEDRAGAATIACPECGETNVQKAIMAPRVSSGGASASAPAPCAGCAETGICPWAGGAGCPLP